MKIFKRLLLVIGVIIILLLVVAAFVKKDYSVEREVVISKPQQEVFDYVKHLKNQDNFSKWARIDPNMKKEYRGTDATVGFVSAWDSDNKNVGKGEQEITHIDNSGRIDFDIRFMKPITSNSTAYMATEKLADDQTRVKWAFQGRMPYPMNAMMLFMNMDKMVGDDLQTGLSNLKGVMEK